MELIWRFLVMQTDFVEEATKVFAATLAYTPVVVFTRSDRLQLVLQQRYRPFGIVISCDDSKCREADPGGYNLRVRRNGQRLVLDCLGCHQRVGNFKQPSWVKIFGSVAVMEHPQPTVHFEWRKKVAAETVYREEGSRGQKRSRVEKP